MKRRSRTKNSRRRNVTEHRRTIAQANMRKRIGKLRREWPRLSGVERGDRLQELANQGCSTRGLAEELHVSATTVRRHIELAQLPQSQREAVESGASAKKRLAEAMHLRKQQRLAERLAIEKRTGQLSDELADVVIAFCKGEAVSTMSMTRDELPVFLTKVAQQVQQLEIAEVPRLRISNRLQLAGRLNAAKPRKSQSDMGIEQLVEWLAKFIYATEPVPAIWESALTKVSRRERELIRRIPMAESIKTLGTYALIEIPARRRTGPASEVMVRQGRKPTR